MAIARVGSIYQHYRTGGQYRIVAIGLHTETEEEMVVYRSVDETDQRVWIRPRSLFEGRVEGNKGDVERFTEILT